MIVLQDLAFKIDLLEELFESVIKSLSLKTACEAYVSLAQIYRKVTEMIEPGVWCTEVRKSYLIENLMNANMLLIEIALLVITFSNIYNNLIHEHFLQDFNIGGKFISSLQQMSEAFLQMHIHQLINTKNWDLLPTYFQTHLLESMQFSIKLISPIFFYAPANEVQGGI